MRGDAEDLHEAYAGARRRSRRTYVAEMPDQPPIVFELAQALHRRYCGQACPPRSELHVADRQWLADAKAVIDDITRDDKRKYRLAVILDTTPMPGLSAPSAEGWDR